MSVITSRLAVALDRAGEADVAARCNLLQACRACARGEFGLLQAFAKEREIDSASHAYMRQAANEILAQYAPIPAAAEDQELAPGDEWMPGPPRSGEDPRPSRGH